MVTDELLIADSRRALGPMIRARRRAAAWRRRRRRASVASLGPWRGVASEAAASGSGRSLFETIKTTDTNYRQQSEQ